MMKNLHRLHARWLLAPAALSPISGHAQVVISDTLTGAASTYNWQAFDGACLTAGDGRASTIPACVGNPYYKSKAHVGGKTGKLPDPIGEGALRLTNGDTKIGGTNANGIRGAVVSKDDYPSNQGLKVTFSTATYGGNGYVGTGADGMSFFLSDSSYAQSVGGTGGTLGYACGHNDGGFEPGVEGGYLSLGSDEFGNFSNRDNVASDGPGGNNVIAIRGSGSITYALLNRLNPLYYPLPGTLNKNDELTAARNTCMLGKLQKWSGSTITDKTGSTIANQASTNEFVHDYQLLTAPRPLVLAIANQQGIASPLRSKATILNYAINITQDNFLSVSFQANGGAVTPLFTKQSITETNGPLPARFRFGFAASTGLGSNIREILCFKAAPALEAGNSAGSSVQQTGKVETGSQVYLAFSHPLNSWGQLTASNLVANANSTVTINPTANWDASCVLSGGSCPATGVTTQAQFPGSRSVLSWNGSAGIALKFGDLSTSDSTALGGTTDGAARLAYLRGDRSGEITTAGTGSFRRRDSLLGDITGASPTWVGAPASPYTAAGSDRLRNAALPELGTAYVQFVADNKSRINMVYAGSNDGMLHGFRSGANDKDGVFSTAVTSNDGRELIAYMPESVISSIDSKSNGSLDFSSPQYAHNSFVDATPGTGDLYYGNAWHTWLVGGLGAGGNPGGVIADATGSANGVLYALDITDPARFSETAPAPANLVLGEWNSGTLACSDDASASCKTSLGSVYGTPIVRLLHDGNWAVIFGNGRNSATGTAGIFVMSVDRASGARTFRFTDTGVKSTTNKNGIDQVTSADLDGDHVTDYIYAGDNLGNMWRFDLTNRDPKVWVTSKPNLMFKTPGGQPISTKVLVSSALPRSGQPRVLVSFGTGRRTPQTLSGAAAYASGAQALYGIWDWDMQAWNNNSNTQYATLPGPNAYTASDLQVQTITQSTGGSGDISGYRTVTQNTVCWKGSTTCTANNTKFGWQLTLPGAGEQIIYNPVFGYGSMLINTSIPGVDNPLECVSEPATGFTMALSIETGGAPATSMFATAATAASIPPTKTIAGIGLNATGSPSIVTAFNKPFLVQQTVSTKGIVTQIDPPPQGTGKRVTWVKLR